MMKKIGETAGTLYGCLFLLLVLARWRACVFAFYGVWHWNGILAGFAGIVTTVIPFVGAIIAYIGATGAWGWKPMSAIIFAAPELILPIILLLGLIWHALTWPFTREKEPPPHPSGKTPYQLAKETEEQRSEVERIYHERRRAKLTPPEDPNARWKPPQ